MGRGQHSIPLFCTPTPLGHYGTGAQPVLSQTALKNTVIVLPPNAYLKRPRTTQWPQTVVIQRLRRPRDWRLIRDSHESCCHDHRAPLFLTNPHALITVDGFSVTHEQLTSVERTRPERNAKDSVSNWNCTCCPWTRATTPNNNNNNGQQLTIANGF